jgi:hypothetical protein
VLGEDHLLGVERAGADVPVDHPERTEGEHGLAGVRHDVAVLIGRRGLVLVLVEVDVEPRAQGHGLELVRGLVEAALGPGRAGGVLRGPGELGLEIGLVGPARHRSEGDSTGRRARVGEGGATLIAQRVFPLRGYRLAVAV